jgi:hypothetical protein
MNGLRAVPSLGARCSKPCRSAAVVGGPLPTASLARIALVVAAAPSPACGGGLGWGLIGSRAKHSHDFARRLHGHPSWRIRRLSAARACSGRDSAPAAGLLLCGDKEVGKKAPPASSPHLRCGPLRECCVPPVAQRPPPKGARGRLGTARRRPRIERRLGCGTRCCAPQTVLAIPLRGTAAFLPLLGEAEGGKAKASPFNRSMCSSAERHFAPPAHPCHATQCAVCLPPPLAGEGWGGGGSRRERRVAQDGRRAPEGGWRGLFELRLFAPARTKRASSAAKPPIRATQGSPLRSNGPRTPGRLFFGAFLLAKQKKDTRPPGRTPGQYTAAQRTSIGMDRQTKDWRRSALTTRSFRLAPTPALPRKQGRETCTSGSSDRGRLMATTVTEARAS